MVVNSQEYCRLCANSGKCVRVFDSEGEKHMLKHKLRVCVPVIVREDDVLPKQVCLICLSTIDHIYEFYQKSKGTQQKLKCLMKMETRKRPLESPETNRTEDSKRLRSSSSSSLDLSAVCPTTNSRETTPGAIPPPPLFARVESGGKSTGQDTVEASDSQHQSDMPGEVVAASASPVTQIPERPIESVKAHPVKSHIKRPAKPKKEAAMSCPKIGSPKELPSSADGVNQASQVIPKEISKLPKNVKLETQTPSPLNSASKNLKLASSVPEPEKDKTSTNLDSSSGKTVPCSYCKRYYSEELIEKHIQLLHKQGLPKTEVKFSCDLCPKSFFVEAAYARHTQRHQANSTSPNKIISEK